MKFEEAENGIQINKKLDSKTNCFQCFKRYTNTRDQVLCMFCLELHCKQCILGDNEVEDDITRKLPALIQIGTQVHHPIYICRSSVEFLRLFKYVYIDKDNILLKIKPNLRKTMV